MAEQILQILQALEHINNTLNQINENMKSMNRQLDTNYQAIRRIENDLFK